ncbi:MAG TPA: NUDIX hydrolase [Gemmataceae bacterium]|nr:NUDIX hydrolase [Gemmataceae bacterium]
MSREVIFRGRKIQLALDRRPSADGQILERPVVLHPGAVVLLPWFEDGRVCLLRNYRYTIDRTLVELPAGTLEPPEPPEAAAVRELAEETGYRASRWTKLAEFYPSPGVMTERMYLFLARDLTPGAMQPEPDEELEPIVVAWQQALAWIDDGTIQDAKTLAGLLLWDRQLRLGASHGVD